MSYSQIDGVVHVPLHDRTLYINSQVTGDVKSAYQSWLTGRPRRRVFDMKREGKLDDDEFKQALHSINIDDAACIFEWGGEGWRESLKQFPGIVKMITLLANDIDLKKYPQSVSEMDVWGWIGDKDIQEVLIASFVEVMNTSPNFLCPPMEQTHSNRNGAGPTSGGKKECPSGSS